MHMKTKVYWIDIFSLALTVLFLTFVKERKLLFFNIKMSKFLQSLAMLFYLWYNFFTSTGTANVLFSIFRCHYWKDKRSWIPCGSQKRNHSNQRHSHDAVQAECWSGISQWPYWTHDRVNNPAAPTTCYVPRWLLLLYNICKPTVIFISWAFAMR